MKLKLDEDSNVPEMVQSESRSEIILPQGLFGFPEIRSMELVFDQDELPFMWLRERKKDKITTSFFEISSENYAIIQIHKNFEMYLNTDLTKATKQDKSRKTSKENTKAPKKLNKTSKLNSTKNSK